MSIGFVVAVGGFAWFDRWIETNITNLDNFKTIFVFLRFEIRQLEKSSWGIKEMVSQAKSKSQVSEFQKNTELSILYCWVQNEYWVEYFGLGSDVNKADKSFDFTSLTIKQ